MVQTGLEILLEEGIAGLRGRRVGVLCHPASVSSRLVHIVDALAAARVNLTRLFGPEHGIRGEAQDMIGVEGDRDPRTGIPVTSLYGETVESLAPTVEAFSNIDVLVVDLQDVGSRYYTFIWTMALSLQAAARAGVAVLVLDRPNPIGGVDIEGGQVDPVVESFVGLGSIPVRHGLTIGEVARLVREGLPWGGERFARPLDCDMQVIAMRGWHRGDYFDQTGLPWVLPSPNMPTVDTALVYPGMCLLEGSNISEGRGTTRPFEIIGAPFLDGVQLADCLAAERLPGVLWRALAFRPTFHKFAGQVCGGVQIHVVDRAAFRPYLTGVAVLRALRALAGEAFRWRTEKYEFVSDRPAIDLLTGGDAIRKGIEAGATLDELRATWQAAQDAFAERRRACLLYETNL
jgi:uncharacterized protein YbbC (DUF1343 family)